MEVPIEASERLHHSRTVASSPREHLGAVFDPLTLAFDATLPCFLGRATSKRMPESREAIVEVLGAASVRPSTEFRRKTRRPAAANARRTRDSHQNPTNAARRCCSGLELRLGYAAWSLRALANQLSSLPSIFGTDTEADTSQSARAEQTGL